MTYYETLHLAPSATNEEIRTAYRKLAMLHHPDRGGNIATFQKIKEAYERLLKTNKCVDCNGLGFIKQRDGYFTVEKPCTTCWGQNGHNR